MKKSRAAKKPERNLALLLITTDSIRGRPFIPMRSEVVELLSFCFGNLP
jgi:hypothetical protein